MTVNKNPYEVRLDILKMTQQMLAEEYDSNSDKFQTQLEALRASNANAEELNTFINTSFPKMYDQNDIITRSSALYSFVNNTSSKKEN